MILYIFKKYLSFHNDNTIDYFVNILLNQSSQYPARKYLAVFMSVVML